MISIDCCGCKFTDIEAIIFDKDGTLEDSGNYLRHLAQKRARSIDAQIPGVGEPLLMAFGVNGNEIDPAGLQAVGSRHENEIAAAAYVAETGRSWNESLDIVREAFTEADRVLMESASAMFPGCLEAIATYASAGLKLGIVSAATTSQVVKFANYHQVDAYFQVLLGSDLQFAKPDPRLFQFACEELGVNPARTLMVGDSHWDMVMASQGGAAGCIGISWSKFRSRSVAYSKSPLAMADVTISSLAELKVDS